MAPPGLAQIILLALAGMTAAAAAALLAWSLRGDRPRGRKRCPRCWYDMSGSAALLCPECGHTARSPRALLRTRRRWKPALAALAIAAAAYSIAVWPRVQKAGPVGLVPTTALVWYVPMLDLKLPAVRRPGEPDGLGPATRELVRRAGAAELWDWQWRWLLARVEVVRSRPAWPVHVPLHVWLGLPRWIDQAVPRLTGSSPLTGAGLPSGLRDDPWKLGAIDPSVREVTISLTDGRRARPWRIPIRPVARTVDAIEPVSTPEIDAAVRRAAVLGAWPVRRHANFGGTVDWLCYLGFNRESGPVPADLALGTAIDLLRDGEVVQSWSARLGTSLYGTEDHLYQVDRSAHGWTDTAIPDIARYTLRVRGDPESSLANVACPRCWAGEFTVPLADILRDPPAPKDNAAGD